VNDGRALRLWAGDRDWWIAAENQVIAGRILERLPDSGDDAEIRAGIASVVRGWVEVSGPLTASGLAATLKIPADDVRLALIQLEGEGAVLRGFFTGASGEDEFCDRRILARIHRATITRLRREIEPVQPATLLRFLFSWQHVASGAQLEGDHGILEVVEQLQGFEAAA